MTTLIVTHPVFALHDTGPGHPERPERMRAIDAALSAPEFDAMKRRDAPLRDDVETQILRAHSPAHLERIRTAARDVGRGPVYLDPDTVVSGHTWEAAVRAVGAVLCGVDAVMTEGDSFQTVFCQVRPPGHHAEHNRAMGFCLFSNVAIGALYARAVHGAQKAAVIDFDVHHGNGTQDIFWSDQDLFYGSVHQMPHYPGTGSASERGVGNIWNAPLKAGDGGAAFRDALSNRIFPALHDFGPDIILVSAGFDGHLHDPLGGLRLLEADYVWVTEQIMDAARRHCRGRIVSVLEGGYTPSDLAASAAAHVRTMLTNR